MYKDKKWMLMLHEEGESTWAAGLRNIFKHREIACSDDFEVLEIVSPADFKTRLVESPTPSVDVV